MRATTLLQGVTDDAARPEWVRGGLGRGAAEEHCDRRGVVLARAPGAAAAEVTAEPAVHRARIGRAELDPAELHELSGGQVGSERLREGTAGERHPDQHAE